MRKDMRSQKSSASASPTVGNVPSIDELVDTINRLDRSHVIEKGELLIALKARCLEEHGHGYWLDLLAQEFDGSVATADNYMGVARLAAKFPNFRNLRLAKMTCYDLATYQPEEELPTILAELGKHATKKRQRPYEAERIIQIGSARHRYGDCPVATLAMLGSLRKSIFNYQKIVDASSRIGRPPRKMLTRSTTKRVATIRTARTRIKLAIATRNPSPVLPRRVITAPTLPWSQRPIVQQLARNVLRKPCGRSSHHLL